MISMMVPLEAMLPLSSHRNFVITRGECKCYKRRFPQNPTYAHCILNRPFSGARTMRTTATEIALLSPGWDARLYPSDAISFPSGT
jgi:hypothetical protein